MVEIISVRFKSGGKQYYFNPDGKQFKLGDGVIVETSKGTEYGECVMANSMIDEMELIAPLRPVVRVATEEDKATVERNREKKEKAFVVCQQKIIEHGLDMKLVDVEYSFEGNKVIFFFTSNGRVDFRALVKDLASAIHARIELRQIGVRDEAKMLGGLGICGRPFCCAQFLDDFQPVSIKMAKTQNLSLNPTKISGTCGRLMCCLKYEQDAYEDLVKTTPKQDSFVETPEGAGTVSSVNLLRQTVQVRLDSAPENAKCFHNCEICVIRNGKGKRPDNYVEPPLEELAKLRRQPDEDELKRTPVSEEDALSAALESAFSRMEPDYQPSQPTRGEQEQGENRRRNRNRNRRPKGEGESRPTVEQKEKPQRPDRPERRERPEKPRNQEEGEGNRRENRRPIRPRKVKLQQEGQESQPVRENAPAEGGEKKPGNGRPFNRRRRRPRGPGKPSGNQE